MATIPKNTTMDEIMHKRAQEIQVIFRRLIAPHKRKAAELAKIDKDATPIDYHPFSLAAEAEWDAAHPGYKAILESHAEADTRDADEAMPVGMPAMSAAEAAIEEAAGRELDALAAAAEDAAKLDSVLAGAGFAPPDYAQGCSDIIYFGMGGKQKKIHYKEPLDLPTDDEEEEQEDEDAAAAYTDGVSVLDRFATGFAAAAAAAPAPVAAAAPAPAPITAAQHRRLMGSKGPRRHSQPAKRIWMTKPEIRRLARRGGVKRISSGVYPVANASLKMFLKHAIEKAVVYTEHAQRKTVTTMDIVMGLKAIGRTIYGF
jgi:histone H4